MSKHFNFDEFDKLCAEALEEEQAWEDYNRVFHPGEIGAVVTRLTTDPELSYTPDPAEPS